MAAGHGDGDRADADEFAAFTGFDVATFERREVGIQAGLQRLGGRFAAGERHERVGDIRRPGFETPGGAGGLEEFAGLLLEGAVDPDRLVGREADVDAIRAVAVRSRCSTARGLMEMLGEQLVVAGTHRRFATIVTQPLERRPPTRRLQQP